MSDAIVRACERLVIEFAQIVDAQEYGRLREVFTADATFARPTDPDKIIRGIDAIIAAYAGRPPNRLTQHLCTNIRIDVDGEDRAHGDCRALLFLADANDPELPGKGARRHQDSCSASSRIVSSGPSPAGASASGVAGCCYTPEETP